MTSMASCKRRASRLTSIICRSDQAKAAFEEDDQEKQRLLPLTPNSQYIYTKELSLGVIVVFELEIPFDETQKFEAVRSELLPMNTRFSSILVNEKGVRYWKKVEVNMEDHVKVPRFPEGLAPEAYQDHLQKYLGKIGMEPFVETKPLWEIHIFNYPTVDAAGSNVIFKLHHVLGDGFSLMGALFSCLKRADDPSLPLTFPPAAKPKCGSEKSVRRMVGNAVAGIWYTACDVTRSVLKSTFVEDGRSAIRSARPRVESRPVAFSTVVLSLERIRNVKTKVGGTVNDVVVGVMFYGFHLYNEKMGQTSQNMTSLVLLNTKMVNGYQSIQEMLETSAWGNNFTFIQVPIPSCENVHKVNPLIFMTKASDIIKRKRKSLEIIIIGSLLKILWKIRGCEAVSRYVYRTLQNTTSAITNLIGPEEKIQIANCPVKNFYFFVTGAPQSIGTMVVSYMDKLTIALILEKGFVDPQLLVSCINDAFERIYQAAVGSTDML